MSRTPEEVFADHVARVNGGEISAILDDYSGDVVILTAQGPLTGHPGVRTLFTMAFTMLPEAEVTVRSLVSSGDTLLVWWSAASPAGRIEDGVDTIVVSDGLITFQTTSFTPVLSPS
jgi:ketosteroid isomerase-like protein